MRPHEPRDRSGSSRDARHARGDHATGGSCLRDRDIVERYLRGESQADIARAVGVSRERVRQRLSRNGLQGRSHGWVPDAVRLAGALATSRSLADAAQRLGLAETRLRAAVARHGMTEALCEAQRRWRRERVEDRRRWRRQQLLEALLDLACRVGHTPTQREMRRAVLCHPGATAIAWAS